MGTLGDLLLDCAARRRSGALQVAGEPGGTVFVSDGMVTGISTPGAPDAEVILLRSGRIPEPARRRPSPPPQRAGRWAQSSSAASLPGKGS
jgi:hypothetical protein